MTIDRQTIAHSIRVISENGSWDLDGNYDLALAQATISRWYLRETLTLKLHRKQ